MRTECCCGGVLPWDWPKCVDCPITSRSRLRRVAAQKGEPAPDFAPDDDFGLTVEKIIEISDAGVRDAVCEYNIADAPISPRYYAFLRTGILKVVREHINAGKDNAAD